MEIKNSVLNQLLILSTFVVCFIMMISCKCKKQDNVKFIEVYRSRDDFIIPCVCCYQGDTTCFIGKKYWIYSILNEESYYPATIERRILRGECFSVSQKLYSRIRKYSPNLLNDNRWNKTVKENGHISRLVGRTYNKHTYWIIDFTHHEVEGDNYIDERYLCYLFWNHQYLFVQDCETGCYILYYATEFEEINTRFEHLNEK